MDDRQIKALAEQNKEQAQEEYTERRERQVERGLARSDAIRIAGARAIASWCVDFTYRFNLDPERFMGTVIDAFANRVRDEDEELE